jgi:prepilin-type N-terminal cleavage/methylation domain-containing protein
MRYTVTRMKRVRAGEAGFTLVELTVTIVIIGIVVVSFFGLFVSLVHSTIIAKRRDAALTLATNQMEYLKSLPYDSLIVQSPTSATKTVNGVKYTIATTIKYVDDAYDGCGSGYNAQTPITVYCRNYPPPSGAPATDLNPADYKIIHVVATDKSGAQLATVDTEIAARVSETASSTGALFVHVLDSSGAAVSGATVNVTDTTVAPVVNKTDSTDSNGTAIFYGLTPDSGNDYVITASKTGYSTLATIGASGSLQPTYANQKVLSQQSSTVTLYIYPTGANSLALETTDVSGSPIANVKVYAKGGYKKYTATTDTSYYFDNMSGSDTRPTTDGSGLAALSNLVPTNGYIFCGDNGDVNCKVGTTTYYLAAAVPYGGINALMPINVPTYTSTNPPTTTYTYSGTEYLQKVRLMLTTNSSFPRVFSMNPYHLSLAGTTDLTSVLVTINGYNLSSANAKFVQGSTTFNPVSGSCSKTTTQLKCSYNFTGIALGAAQLVVSNSSGTLTLPTTPLGGFNVEN